MLKMSSPRKKTSYANITFIKQHKFTTDMFKSHTISKETAIENRNASWNKNPTIPSWVDINSVGLDQFYTRKDIAEKCYDSLLFWMRKDGVNESNIKFIEPSVGMGAFYDLLPRKRRIGVDIMPNSDDIVEADYLTWEPIKNGHNYAVIGNPPFGYRAWLALSFINHSAKFSDYLGFILPMAFQSEGKGSPKHRVVGMELVHTEYLPNDSFVDASGKLVKINALWQVWRRGVNSQKQTLACDDWLDLFTVDMRKERLCGQKRLNEADYFLQRTFYKDPPSLVKSFSEVRYVCGYGIVVKKDKRKIIKLLNNVDWTKYSNLAAHNCRHISMYHIRNALTDEGYIDGK